MSRTPIPSYAGDISPDGSRFYGLDVSSSLKQLRVFDLTANGFPDLTPVAVPDMAGDGTDHVVLDPRGQAAIVIDDAKFIVVDLR